MTNRPIDGAVSTLGHSHGTGSMLGHAYGYHASLTRPAEALRVAWSTSIVCKYPQKSMESNEKSLEINGNHWESMKIHCVCWIFMRKCYIVGVSCGLGEPRQRHLVFLRMPQPIPVPSETHTTIGESLNRVLLTHDENLMDLQKKRCVCMDQKKTRLYRKSFGTGKFSRKWKLFYFVK